MYPNDYSAYEMDAMDNYSLYDTPYQSQPIWWGVHPWWGFRPWIGVRPWWGFWHYRWWF